MERELAYAKINLCLSVTGQAGAFHALDMLVVSVDLADTLMLADADCAPCVEFCDGAVAAGAVPTESNALRAVRGMSAICGRKGAHVRIERNIPDQCGLGGSSADAAGIVRLLARVWGVSLDDARVAALCETLGSDVPCMLHAGWKRVRGRGELVEPIASALAPYFVLCADGTASTPKVFAAYDDAPVTTMLDAKVQAVQTGVLPHPHNDLTQAACSVAPGIGGLLQSLSMLGVPYGMTGSGACCFAVAESRAQAESLAAQLQAPFVRMCRAVL